MTPSEQLELTILQFADASGKGQWRDTSVSTNWPNSNLYIDAIHDLHSRKFLEIRLRDKKRNVWVMYGGRDREECLTGNFDMRTTFAGRKFLESLEANVEKQIGSSPTQTDQRALSGSSVGPLPDG